MSDDWPSNEEIEAERQRLEAERQHRLDLIKLSGFTPIRTVLHDLAEARASTVEGVWSTTLNELQAGRIGAHVFDGRTYRSVPTSAWMELNNIGAASSGKATVTLSRADAFADIPPLAVTHDGVMNRPNIDSNGNGSPAPFRRTTLPVVLNKDAVAALREADLMPAPSVAPSTPSGQKLRGRKANPDADRFWIEVCRHVKDGSVDSTLPAFTKAMIAWAHKDGNMHQPWDDDTFRKKLTALFDALGWDGRVPD